MVIHVAVGNEHTLALTETGELYGWGRNTGGEVVSSAESVATPTLIEGVSSITYISCGPTEVSMCVTCVDKLCMYSFNVPAACIYKVP